MLKYTGRLVAGIVGGLIIALLGSILLTIMFASAEDSNGNNVGLIGFFALFALSLLIAIKSRSAGKAWRTIFFLSSAFSFALPLSTIIFSGRIMSETESGAEAVGAAIGGGLIALFAGFVGFFLGVVFLILGFVVGRGDVDAHTSQPQQAPLPTEEPDS